MLLLYNFTEILIYCLVAWSYIIYLFILGTFSLQKFWILQNNWVVVENSHNVFFFCFLQTDKSKMGFSCMHDMDDTDVVKFCGMFDNTLCYSMLLCILSLSQSAIQTHSCSSRFHIFSPTFPSVIMCKLIFHSIDQDPVIIST